MIKPKRLKPYKNAPPYDTVERARKILKDCDAFVSENTFFMSSSKTFTSRIWLSDDGIRSLKIGTNGKGMTARYALASAYGELMERIQNMCLNLHGTPECFPEGYFFRPSADPNESANGAADSIHSFLFSPDERWRTVEETLTESSDVLRQMRLYKTLKEEELRRMLTEFSYKGRLACVPFYSIDREKTVYLPYKIIKVNVLCNGMCAGNTPKEAIIQGLSEIYERYAQQMVIMENREVPSIPDEYFEGTEVYKKLQGLKQQGITVDILDFSCNKGLPVVALKLINENGEISIHPGADPCPITALERCLTETYQGAESLVTKLRYRAKPIRMPDTSDEDQVNEFYANLKECFELGAGGYPDNIHNYKRNPGFKEFDHPVSGSDADDLRFMLSVAKKNGFEVFVRDNSYLGFPAFDVFIPGMSDIAFFRGPKAKNYLEYGKELRTLLSLPTADLKDVEALYAFLQDDARNKYAAISIRDCFPLGIGEYMPEDAFDVNIMLEALKGQIHYLREGGEAVFTRDNWPVCEDCEHCAYHVECRQKAFMKVFQPFREQLFMNCRPQTAETLKEPACF